MIKKIKQTVNLCLIMSSLLLSSCGSSAASAVSSAASSSTASTVTTVQSSASDDIYYATPATLDQGRSTLFNEDWKFYLGEADSAESQNYNDTSWNSVTLPHDWSVALGYSTDGEAESGFMIGGTGWYRKSFTMDESDQGKRVTINFDGVYMNATVYLNGRKLGSHPYGYTAFSFDLSNDLICDGSTENVLAVKVENILPNSRWYSGSGIGRDVYLTITDQVHVSDHGITVTTPDLETQQNGLVDTVVTAAISNDTSAVQDTIIRSTVYDDSGNAVSDPVETSLYLEAESSDTASLKVPVNQPSLWSTDSPTLYTVNTEVLINSQVVDQKSETFGYRYFSFDNDTGFSLNGTAMKLQGVCMHQDQGALGSVSNARAIDRQLSKLKDMGVNAIRVTHNPACAELLDACNRMGFVVIEEAFDTWSNNKNGNTYDYGTYFNETVGSDNEILGGSKDMTWAEYDIKAMVNSAKNDPCVILWSIGNEILGNIAGDTSNYAWYADELCDWVQEIDTTRPLTIADNKLMDGDDIQLAMDEKVVNHGGIIGLNYATAEEYDQIHADHPDWILYGSETASDLSTRGWYSTTGIDRKNYQVSAYDGTAVEWGSSSETAWDDVISRDYVAGEFVWTGFDYTGEPEPWNGVDTGSVSDGSPAPKSSYFGQLDTAGFEKDSYWFYKSQWDTDSTVVHILPDWNKEDLKTDLFGYVRVNVYSNASAVELFLNGKSLGKQSFTAVSTDQGYAYQQNDGSLYLTWKVAYKSGTLTAVAYDSDGNVIQDTAGRNTVSTSAEASVLNVSADRTAITADGQDLSYITVDFKDADGNPVYSADNEVSFHLVGDGTIIGVDNGNPMDTSSCTSDNGTDAVRSAFSGKVLVIVQSTKNAGSFTLTASAEGMSSADITVNTVNQ